MGPGLKVRKLVKRFGDTAAVHDVSFDLPAGLFLSLLGPSGSGKTTVLRLLCGFEIPNEGRIEIDGSDISLLPPHRREIGVVFQRYALFPHLSVAENVGFPLKQRGIRKADRDTRIEEILEMVGLAGFGDRSPSRLSGGEQQRVALARALVFRPRILVMDEPLAALDRRLRERLQQEIRALQRRLQITTVYVTHDQTEAFAMSDLVAVINKGAIEQVDTPRVLYEAPRTEFVARFVGDSNILRGESADENLLHLADGTVVRFPGTHPCGGPVTLLVRPEKISMKSGDAAGPDRNALSGSISDVIFLGETVSVRISTGGREFSVRAPNDASMLDCVRGAPVTVSWSVADTVVL